MTNGQQVTGTRDEHYNLVSVLYHTLQEGETIERYIDDARQAGDDELAEFFHAATRVSTSRRLSVAKTQPPSTTGRPDSPWGCAPT